MLWGRGEERHIHPGRFRGPCAEEPGQSQAEARLSGLALPFFLLLKIKEYVIHFLNTRNSYPDIK